MTSTATSRSRWFDLLPIAIVFAGLAATSTVFGLWWRAETNTKENNEERAIVDLGVLLEAAIDTVEVPANGTAPIFIFRSELPDRQVFVGALTAAGTVSVPGVEQVAWAPAVPVDELDAFVEAVRADGSINDGVGYPAYAVDDLTDDPFAMPVAFVVPPVGTDATYGYNILADPLARVAYEASAAVSAPVITDPMALPMLEGNPQGALVVRAVFRGPPPDPAFIGAYFIVVEFDVLFATLVESSDVDFVVSDVDEGQQDLVYESVSGVVASDIVEEVETFGRTWRVALAEGAFEGPAMFTATIIWAAGVAISLGLAWSSLSLNRSNARIDRQIVELAEVNSTLNRTNQSLLDFTHAASHDLRSPLRAIVGLISFIREDDQDLGAETSERLAEIDDRATRMNRLIDDLLTYAAAGADGETPTRFEVAGLVEEIRADLDVPDGLSLSSMDGAGAVVGHRIALETSIRNLIENAIKHHDQPEDGNVSVSSQNVGGRLRVEVTDDGPGIPPEYREAVFEPFRRLDKDSEAPGSGIGLALVARLAQSHGGSVTVAPGEGRGATFVVDWPLGEDT